MNLEEMIDGYNDLREKCLRVGRKNNAELLADSAWLRYAIDEIDITLEYQNDGVYCYGCTYTTQTMSLESFGFLIPFSELEGE
jgi:hypothetical protein